MPSEIQNVLDKHEQQRPLSCFQSAVEMVLKLNSILSEGDYPEQSITANDGCGYEPFAGKKKRYGRFEVSFEEIKFDPLGDAIKKGRELLEEDIYPIYSFMLPDRSGYHGFVGFKNEMDDISFFTKAQLGPCAAHRFNLLEIIIPQTKTEILLVRFSGVP